MNKQLAEWIEIIGNSDIPIFKSTVNTISQVTAKADTSAGELAGAILQDPSLSARILQFANSSYYNSSRTQVNTISRAVILLGFEVVRDLSLSLAIIESLLSAKKRTIISELIAKSFLAAIQARNIARLHHETSLEEIFLATLLSNLGEISFWCVADDRTIDLIFAAINDNGMDFEQAQLKILGFKLSELTGPLRKKWHLTLWDDQSSRLAPDRRTKYIVLGNRIVTAIQEGWESQEMKDLNKIVAGLLEKTLSQANKLIRENAQIAVEAAATFGAFSVAQLIPGYEAFQQPKEPEPAVEYPAPAPLLQLQILRDLSSILKTNMDLNLVIDTVLEGLHRGVGMDRAVFALYSPLKSQVRAKHVVGINTESLLASFAFSVGDVTKNPFSDLLLEKKSTLWMKAELLKNYSNSIVKQINAILSTKEFFMAPIVINDRSLGLFYADRQPSKRPLDQESFDSFDHFIHQATLAIHFISQIVSK